MVEIVNAVSIRVRRPIQFFYLDLVHRDDMPATLLAALPPGASPGRPRNHRCGMARAFRDCWQPTRRRRN